MDDASYERAISEIVASLPTMTVERMDATTAHPRDCVNCGEVIVGTWYVVDGDALCGRPDCGPAYVYTASDAGRRAYAMDRLARPAQYR